MTKKEELEVLCRQLLEHAREVVETPNVRDCLTRLHEVKLLHRQIGMHFDRVENQLAQDFKKQSGMPAFWRMWPLLARNLRFDGGPTKAVDSDTAAE